MSPLIPKLWARFVEAGVQMPTTIPPDCEIRRVHAGHWQRSAGAWSWHLWSQSDSEAARILMGRGSQWTARECVRAKNISVYESGFDAALTISYPRRHDDHEG